MSPISLSLKYGVPACRNLSTLYRVPVGFQSRLKNCAIRLKLEEAVFFSRFIYVQMHLLDRF